MKRWALGLMAGVMLICLAAPVSAGQETADLRLTKTSSSPTVRLGGLVTYTVIVTNLGPSVATGVEFGDPMPDQLNLVDSTCGSVSAFCTVDTLAVGASVTLTIVGAPINNLAKSERRISNTAFIAQSATVDPNPDNDQASARVQVVGRLKP